MGIYTRTGDSGSTSLRRGRRVPKRHRRVEALGALDELGASLGVSASLLPRRRDLADLRTALRRAQAELLLIGPIVASPSAKGAASAFPASAASRLEREIDRMSRSIGPLRDFVLQGGAPPAAFLHLSRTVCRRAERILSALPRRTIPASTRAYVNRLSDFLFIAAQWTDARLGSKLPGRRASGRHR